MPETTSEQAEPYNYTYRAAPYATPEGQASAPQSLRDSQAAEAVPDAGRVPDGPVPGAFAPAPDVPGASTTRVPRVPSDAPAPAANKEGDNE